jgi:hypothetical protein
MNMEYRRFFLLGAVALSMGTLIAAGCGDSETGGSGGAGTTGSTTTSTGSMTTTSSGMGGAAMCTPGDDCEQCAADECTAEAAACCMKTGCRELVRCVGEKCQGVPAAMQQACALEMCPNEVTAGSGAVAEAQALGACITPQLMDPAPGSACESCAMEFGVGGMGQGGAGGN